MSRGAVGRTVRGGLARKRVHAIVIGLVHDLITPITQISNYQDMTPFVLAAIALLVMSRGQVMSRSREEG